MTRHWERPNWKNSEEYPAPTETNLHQWYWQFLRRRQEYITDYWSYADETYKTHCETNALMGLGSDDTYRPEDEEFNAQIPSAHRDYSILVCPNPKNNRPEGFSYTADKTISYFKASKDDGRCHVSLSSNQVGIKFNVQLPIAQQLESARKILEIQQAIYSGVKNVKDGKVQTRRHFSKWPNYLRALDATDQGETLEEIGLVLSASCLSDEGLENHLFKVGSEKLKRIGQTTVDAAREVQFNFPY